MYFCPPQPGLTVITSTWSTRSSTFATATAGVAGFIATAARGAELADRAERAVQVPSRLGVHDQGLAARLEHRPSICSGVSIMRWASNGTLTSAADRRDDVGTEGDDGHELAVHHVELHAVAAGLLELDHALGETALVDREHRRDDRDWLHDETLRPTARPYARPMLRLRPTSMAAGGAALARDDDGRVVFVEGALPGELVDVEVFEEHIDYAKANVVSVEEPVAGRVSPPCPYVAAGCGGCGWQHIDPAVQVELKREIVADALRRIGRLANPVVVGRPGACRRPGYRTTVRMGVQGGRAGSAPTAATISSTSTQCLVAHPLLADLIRDGRYGDAREVVLRCGVGTGERLVLASPSARGVDVPDDVVLVGQNEVKRGRTARFHEVVHGRRFTISATSFFQARTDGAAALVDAVREVFVDDDELGTFVDTYCGVGLFAGLLGGDRKVVGVERNGPAVRDARDNLGSDAQVVRAEIAMWNPVPARVVVADPARPGVGREGGGSARRDRCHPVDPRELRSRVPRPRRPACSRAWGSRTRARP